MSKIETHATINLNPTGKNQQKQLCFYYDGGRTGASTARINRYKSSGFVTEEENENQSGNRKSLYTKRQFAQGFLKLLEEKPFRSLTVSELCEAAGCSRPSFYRNFDSIGEVFSFHIRDKIDGFIALRESSGAEKSSVDTAILELWGSEQGFVALIMRRGLLNDFIMTVCRYLYELHIERNPAQGAAAEDELAMVAQYQSAMQAYYTGAVLYAWAESGLIDGPEEIRRVLSRIRSG